MWIYWWKLCYTSRTSPWRWFQPGPTHEVLTPLAESRRGEIAPEQLEVALKRPSCKLRDITPVRLVAGGTQVITYHDASESRPPIFGHKNDLNSCTEKSAVNGGFKPNWIQSSLVILSQDACLYLRHQLTANSEKRREFLLAKYAYVQQSVHAKCVQIRKPKIFNRRVASQFLQNVLRSWGRTVEVHQIGRRTVESWDCLVDGETFR